MTVPVQILHRQTQTDPGTGQVQDTWVVWGQLLASVQVRPLSETDAAGKLRTGRTYQLLCWRVPTLLAAVSTRDRVRLYLAEGPVEADIAAIAPQDEHTIYLEARSYDAA
jgi:hypothetical protein